MWNTLFGESTSLFDEFNWLSREMDRLFEPMGIPALRTAGARLPCRERRDRRGQGARAVLRAGHRPGRRSTCRCSATC